MRKLYTNKPPKIYTEAYEELANAIIIRAVEDYKRAIISNNKSLMLDCENFFKSSYYSALTQVDGQFLINRIKEEFKNGKEKTRENKDIKL